MLVLTAYGVIALGRGALTVLLTKTVIGAVPLVPRYHYVGQLSLTVLLCVVVARLAEVRLVPVKGILLAAAAAPPGGAVRIENRGFAPLPFTPSVFPGWAAVFTIFFPDNVVEGRRVYFVDRHPTLIEALRHGKRTRSLVVPP